MRANLNLIGTLTGESTGGFDLGVSGLTGKGVGLGAEENGEGEETRAGEWARCTDGESEVE